MLQKVFHILLKQFVLFSYESYKSELIFKNTNKYYYGRKTVLELQF